MSISIQIFDQNKNEDWNSFVDKSINGNFLHTRSFYDSNPKNSTDDLSFFFVKKNKIIAILGGVLYEQNNSLIFHSHLRSTYGGFIINQQVGVLESIQMVGLLIEELKKRQVNKVIIRNPFRIFYSKISDEVEYALWYHDFTIQSRELEIYVDLKLPLDTIRKSYDNGTKYNIKKALKSVSVEKSSLDLLPSFWEILETNLALKFNKKPVHNLSEIQTLISNTGDNVYFFGAYLDNKLVGGCLIFKINNLALHAQYIAQDDSYQEFRPINAVLDYIIQWGKENGFSYFNLGTANEGGKIINEGLFHFKESFGGRGVLRETHQLTLSYE
jgi:hypothetical protein